MGTLSRRYCQTLLSHKGRQLTCVSLWILTMQEINSRAARICYLYEHGAHCVVLEEAA
jgi:hypothetical protein